MAIGHLAQSLRPTALSARISCCLPFWYVVMTPMSPGLTLASFVRYRTSFTTALMALRLDLDVP